MAIYDADISIDMPTIKEKDLATQFVVPSSEVGEAAQGQEPYNPKMVVYAPGKEKGSQKLKNQIKKLKEYFSQPNTRLASFLGDLKYTGPIDNCSNEELNKLASHLEKKMLEVLPSLKIEGKILQSSPEEIDTSLSDLIKYQQYLGQKSKWEHLDDRFLALSQLLLKK